MFVCRLQAEPPAGYYDAAEGKTGPALRAALHEIINSHTVISYGSADTALQTLDEDPANPNNIILVYSRKSVAKSSGSWNREHVWPNSLGIDSSGPAYSDLLHLRPEDTYVNSARGNLYFDVSDPSDAGYRNPAHADAPGSTMDSNSWEPADAAKGDVARAVLYMDVRYEGDQSNENDLAATDNVGLINTSAAYMGKLSTLLTWHLAHPVTAFEVRRNDLVYSNYQHNRNPFVDHPEYAILLYTPNQTVPVITNQPQSVSVIPGAAAKLSVVSLGASPLSYQWRFNGTNVAGATRSSYSIASVQGAQAGSYVVVVTNSLGAVTSVVASVSLSSSNSAPTILAQPQSVTVTAGQSATFQIIASGSAPLAYQWRFNGLNLSGATLSSYARPNAQMSDAGSYSVVVSNSVGSVTSANAILTVTTADVAPSIVSQPQSQTVSPGQNVIFTVLASGSAPLSYQWRINGTPIALATDSQYSVLNAQASSEGSYSVLVTNAFGSVPSANAALRVLPISASGVIAQWNFNNTNSLSSPPPSVGAGVASLVGGATSAYAGGSTNDSATSSNYGWNTTTYPNQGTGNKSRGVQFNVSTRGWQNIVVSWDERVSGTANKYYRLQYSTNGTDFFDGNTAIMVGNSVFESKTNSLAAIAGVNDNPNFAIRIVAEFESTAINNANANYATASTSSYAPTGTARFDMVTISGSPVVVAGSLQLLSCSGEQVQLRIEGVNGSRYAVQCSTNLLEWTWLQTNAAPFTFTDSNLAGKTARFYRSVYLP